MSPTIMSGLKPSSSSALAPPSTARIAGFMSRMYGAQRAEVLLVVDAAHDDERRAVAEVRVEARQLDAPGEQLALLEHVLDRVLRERLERVADLAAALVGGGAHGLGLLDDAAGEELVGRAAPRRRGR